ncbi:MAG: biotin carboxylase N-terminal domain-containing protein [Pseudomonadota bacterium]|nr:biotin carboxylase N-terminal domain-containing protein [Pseudomonadota bacterium]
MPIHRLLIANRGEIAIRVARTAREMGIATVAVYSDADVDAPHVRACDDAVRLGPAPPSESYLSIDRLLEAARTSGADAVHPGYGFLAENAAFARAVLEAGLVWVGPAPDVISVMGDKVGARLRMRLAGVPVVTGVESDDPHTIAALGFPVLVKAVGGGGGKGMRRVDSADALGEALAEARSEAATAFGDPRVYAEKLVERPRHVEVQVLGDLYGTIAHLGERECSIQRRHQKLVEEAPSPALDAATRARLCATAVDAARAVAYTGAGTVEFLLDGDGRFYFLEMNTRIQVEHPVTELVTGVDIVREQLRIAMGEPLGYVAIEARGHAIECRIVAEDPARGFLPSPGRIARWRSPVGPGVRVDAGVEEGSEVGLFYDPLLAKVIVHGPDRAAATARMARALSELVVLGVDTTAELLRDVVSSEMFAAGDTTTDFLERFAWEPPEVDAVAYAVAWENARQGPTLSGSGTGRVTEASPWATLGRWR